MRGDKRVCRCGGRTVVVVDDSPVYETLRCGEVVPDDGIAVDVRLSLDRCIIRYREGLARPEVATVYVPCPGFIRFIDGIGAIDGRVGLRARSDNDGKLPSRANVLSIDIRRAVSGIHPHDDVFMNGR